MNGGPYILLGVGVLACSTAAIMIKSCACDDVLLASYRLLAATVILLPLFCRDLARHRGAFTPGHLLKAAIPGLFMGAHFVLWILGTRRTAAANATLIVTMVPVVTPFLLVILARERLNVGELVGTAAALAGVGVLGIADFHFDVAALTGDLLCFLSMLFLAVYLVMAKRNHDFPSIWLYVVPLYGAGGIGCLCLALAMGTNPAAVGGTRGLYMILGLAIIPTVLGHSIFNYCMKKLRGQVVAVAGLGQFIFAGILAYFILEEVPALALYPAGLLVVVGSVIAIRATPRSGLPGK